MFFVSFNNVILHEGYIFTTNETFVCKEKMKPLFLNSLSLMNFQKLLLLFIHFSVMLFKCFFKDFLRNDTHMFLCFLYAKTFSLEGFWFSLLFNLLLVQIAFWNSLATKWEGLALKTFSFNEPCLFTTSRNLFEMKWIMNNCFQNFPHLVWFLIFVSH